jgi:hypothetical protein
VQVVDTSTRDKSLNLWAELLRLRLRRADASVLDE